MNNQYKEIMEKITPSKDFHNETVKILLKKNKVKNRVTNKKILGIAACVIFVCSAIFATTTIWNNNSSEELYKSSNNKDEAIFSLEPSSTQNQIVVSSKYNLGDLSSYMFEHGQCIVSNEVRAALADNDANAYYFVKINISDENEIITNYDYELNRLTQLGYNVFIYSTKTHSKSTNFDSENDILCGLLSSEQILDFDTQEKYGYIIEWVRDENGIIDWEN